MVSCKMCGKLLTNPDSVELGIGPICRKKNDVKFQSDELKRLAEVQPIEPDIQFLMLRSLKRNRVTVRTTVHSKIKTKEREFRRAGHEFIDVYRTSTWMLLDAQLLEPVHQSYIAIVYDVVDPILNRSELIIQLFKEKLKKKDNPCEKRVSRWMHGEESIIWDV